MIKKSVSVPDANSLRVFLYLNLAPKSLETVCG